MKTNTFKIGLAALLAHLMCATVVLSHVHAKDAVSLANKQIVTKLSSNDITAKALGDLHHHIDKTTLKGAAQSSDAGTQVRVRELKPLVDADFTPSVRDQVEEFFLRFHFGASLLLRQLL